jgi:hypothetical protein
MLKSIVDFLIKELHVPEANAGNIVVTLFTFFLGFLITWGASFSIKLYKKHNYRKILKVILRQYFDRCKIQNEELEKFSEEKGWLFGDGYKIIIASNFSQTYLSGLDIKVFIENFSSIFETGRAKQIALLFEVIENVKYGRELLNNITDVTFKNYQENNKIYNDNLDNLRMLHDDIPVKYDGKLIDVSLVSFLEGITQIFTQWACNSKSTLLNDTLEQIVNPIYDLGVKTKPSCYKRSNRFLFKV